MHTLKHARPPLRASLWSRIAHPSVSAAAAAAPITTHPASSGSTTALTPITSLLIANRGEIALRIARTAAAMGIRTTTLYTDIDAHSQHARCSPSSIALGRASGSYLDGPRIVKLARARGVQALHPGYGFLSENAGFARACEDAGILFVGPPSQAMADMGDKARSKEIMTAAGVSCVPGYHGSKQTPAELAGEAAAIGYPVLLKSVKGGGGKGMRIVRTAAEFEPQLRSARAEARASFGDGGETMLVERYVERPRHVEVQVFADRHGACVALGERDCSVQRRHQKVLEESPAPGLDEATRMELWDRARTAALAVGYVGAGTVEFILDRDTGEFYFMEMNTRLQVEHPVSEMVTGTDLVEWQFRVAAGERLPLTQRDVEERIRERGHAIEARIYAESPERGFFPDSGRLVHLRTPPRASHDPDVRIDAGFVEGDTVSEAYDGMIAKLIVRGPDRETAIRKMDLALMEYEVVGPATNIEFLKRVCQSRAFIDGDVETGFIEKWKDELLAPRPVADEVFAQAALGLLLREPGSRGQLSPRAHGESLGFGEPRSSALGERTMAFQVLRNTNDEGKEGEDETVRVSVSQQGNAVYHVAVSRGGKEPQAFEDIICETTTPASSGHSFQPPFAAAAKTHLTSFYPSARIESTVVQEHQDQTSPSPSAGNKVTVFQLGHKTELRMVPAAWFDKALGLSEAAASVVAPMPCKILRNEVREGEAVEKGAPLVVIESMKMETVIRSPQNGIVKRLAHKEGDICKAGTVLVLFEDESKPES